MKKGTTPLDPHKFKEMADKDDILVLDTRTKESYTNDGTIPGALWIGLTGSFAPWVGALITDINQKIIFICDEDIKANEVVTRLSRVGYDNSVGYLAGGLVAWKDAGFEVDTINSLSAAGFAKKFKAGECEAALDVRKESEYQSEHVIGVDNFPLDFINKNIGNLDKNKDYYLHCASGYRSLIAASIFKANGINKVTDIRGGFIDLKETDLEISEYVCPTTLL